MCEKEILEAMKSIWKHDVFAVQEYPKGNQGWSRLDCESLEDWTFKDIITC